MAEINSFLKLFDKLTLSKIGFHFSLIADLYIRPLKSWKRILSPRKTSRDYFITYVLYYALLVFLITWDLRSTIVNVFLNLLITLIPFVFLFIPFKGFTYFFGKRIKANRPYRLFFVFYVQIVPFIYFPDIIAEWANLESPYQISSNMIILQSLLIIFVVPFMIKLSISKRILWVFVNYIFAGLYILLLNLFIIESKDFRLILQKAGNYSPVEEFDNIISLYKKSDWYLNQNLIYVYSEIVPDGRLHHNDLQFVTLFTEDYLTEKANNVFKYQAINEVLKTDINNLVIYFDKKEMDSLRFEFNKIFYSDLKLMDSLKLNAKFKSNRNYVNYVHKYLKQFDIITEDSIYFKNLIFKKKPLRRIAYNVNKYISTYQLDKRKIKYNLDSIINLNLEFGKRKENSSILPRLFYYPIFKGIGEIYPFHSYQEKFHNIEFLDDSARKNPNRWTRIIKGL